MHSTTLLTTLLTLLPSATSQTAPDPPTCNAVQIFIARGHGESVPGLQTTMVDAVCAGRPSCGSQSISYNATSALDTLCRDQYAGVIRAWADVAQYAAQCPASRLVLTGWSRGGALVSDLLAGGGGIPLALDLCEQPVSPPLDPDGFPGSRIAAVLNFGVLHHNANQPWNVGDGSALDGRHPRNEQMLQNLGRWADRFRDYCTAGDPLCAQGTNVTSHEDYFELEEWRVLAAEFVSSRLDG